MTSAAIRNELVDMSEANSLDDEKEILKVVVQILKIQRGQIGGVIYNLSCGVITSFGDLSEMVIKLDDMVDMAQAVDKTEARSEVQDRLFSGKKRSAKQALPAPIEISIFGREYFSLQGQLRARGVPTTFAFRSAMELMRLIHSAACDCEDFDTTH